MGKLTDKTAIITGGAGGIGKGMATAFVKEGANVAIVDMNEEMGQETVTELQKYQPESMFIKADLSDHDNLPSILETVVSAYGRLDILVNNAHATKLKSFEETTREDMDLSMNTGFYPTFYLMQAAMPYLKEVQGSIINFASGAALEGHPTQASYAAAKEAIRAISRVAANEYGKFGVNVNLISPIAKSPGVDAWKEQDPEYYQSVLENIPMRRFGELEEDIGQAAVFLASDDSNYIRGPHLMVDGGSIKLR